jgi:hypothetical protein
MTKAVMQVGITSPVFCWQLLNRNSSFYSFIPRYEGSLIAISIKRSFIPLWLHSGWQKQWCRYGITSPVFCWQLLNRNSSLYSLIPRYEGSLIAISMKRSFIPLWLHSGWQKRWCRLAWLLLYSVGCYWIITPPLLFFVIPLWLHSGWRKRWWGVSCGFSINNAKMLHLAIYHTYIFKDELALPFIWLQFKNVSY